MSTRKTRSLALAAVLLSAMLLSACGLFGPSPDATPLPSPLLTPSAPPAATPVSYTHLTLPTILRV